MTDLFRIGAPVIDGPAPEGFEPGPARLGLARSHDDPRSRSLSALHLAVLQDGHRLILLDDRGWSESGPPGIWARTSIDDLEATARMVVGPDEPFGSYSQADMETDHWADLAGTLRQQGVLIDAEELSRLPHDVELTERFAPGSGTTDHDLLWTNSTVDGCIVRTTPMAQLRVRSRIHYRRSLGVRCVAAITRSPQGDDPGEILFMWCCS